MFEIPTVFPQCSLCATGTQLGFKSNFRLHYHLYLFLFLLIFGVHESFLWGHWYPCFGLLVTSPLGFKARVDPLLACFLTCAQRIPEIHLWCDTCWPLGGQHGSRSSSLHATYVAEVGCQNSIRIYWWLVRATYVVDGLFLGDFFWKLVGTVCIHMSHVQLPYTVINMWRINL